MIRVQIPTQVSIAALEDYCLRVLRRIAVSEEHAQLITDALVTTDSWGVFTHGTKLLAGYARRLQAGGLRTDVQPSVVSEGPAWAIVDGQSLPAQVTSCVAMQHAIKKARNVGVAYVGVKNSCNFGAAGYYAWLAAREGLIGISMANDVPSVAAPGSRQAVIGSNPIAYAIPAGDHDPILLDMSIATVAGGKVYARHKRGESIPEGWLIGSDGQPTTDGSLFPHQTSLTPFGGYKGYGIGLLIEGLSGVLTGAAVTSQVRSWIFDDGKNPTNHGAAFLAINTDALMPIASFRERIDNLIDEIHSAPTADGFDQLLVPGEREWAYRRTALEHGLELPDDVASALADLASDLGVELFQE
jgi:ureidoglycolate dehydrogenase (NAD+)